MDIGLLGFLVSLGGWCFGKGSGYRALGDIRSLPKAAIWGKVVDTELWGFQAPPGGCYFGKGCGYRAFGIFGPSPLPINLEMGPQIQKALYIGNLLY